MPIDRNHEDPVQGAAADEDHFRQATKQTSGQAAERAAAFFSENAPPENPNFEPRISLPLDAVEFIKGELKSLRYDKQEDIIRHQCAIENYLFLHARPVSIFKEVPSVERQPRITVYDWSYTGTDGRQHYASTPENAEMLRKAGIPLTTLYTVEDMPPPTAEVGPAPWPYTPARMIDVFDLADIAKLPPDALRKMQGDVKGAGPTNAKEYAAAVLFRHRRDVWREAIDAVGKHLRAFLDNPFGLT